MSHPSKVPEIDKPPKGLLEDLRYPYIILQTGSENIQTYQLEIVQMIS